MRCFNLAAVLIVILVSTCAAQEHPPLVFVETRQVSFDQPPLLIGEAVLVPLESAVGYLGGSVRWEPQLTAVVGYRGVEVGLRPGDPFAYTAPFESLSDRRIHLDIPPRFHAGLFFVTVRFFANALGVHVDWDAATSTLLMRSPPIPRDPRLRTPPKGGFVSGTVARVDLHRKPFKILTGEPGRLIVWILTPDANITRLSLGTNELTQISLDRVYPGHLIRMWIRVDCCDPNRGFLSSFQLLVREVTGWLQFLTANEVGLSDGRSFPLYEAVRFFVGDTAVLPGTVLPGRRVVLRINPSTGLVVEVVELD